MFFRSTAQEEECDAKHERWDRFRYNRSSCVPDDIILAIEDLRFLDRDLLKRFLDGELEENELPDFEDLYYYREVLHGVRARIHEVNPDRDIKWCSSDEFDKEVNKIYDCVHWYIWDYVVSWGVQEEGSERESAEDYDSYLEELRYKKHEAMKKPKERKVYSAPENQLALSNPIMKSIPTPVYPFMERLPGINSPSSWLRAGLPPEREVTPKKKPLRGDVKPRSAMKPQQEDRMSRGRTRKRKVPRRRDDIRSTSAIRMNFTQDYPPLFPSPAPSPSPSRIALPSHSTQPTRSHSSSLARPFGTAFPYTLLSISSSHRLARASAVPHFDRRPSFTLTLCISCQLSLWLPSPYRSFSSFV